MAKELKKPSSLTLTRDGWKFTAKWKKIDTKKNTAEKLRITWYTSADGKKWSKVLLSTDKSGKKHYSKDLKLSDTSEHITLSASSYYPIASKNLKAVKVELSTYGAEKEGKKKKWSDAASKSFVYAVPPASSVSKSYDKTEEQVKFTVDCPDKNTVNDEAKGICTMVSVETWREVQGTNKKTNVTAQDWTKVSDQTVFPRSESTVAPVTAFRWGCKATSKGPAGAASTSTDYYYFSVPNTPEMGDVSKVGDVQYRVKWESNSDTWHPVDKIEILYGDVPYGTDEQDVTFQSAHATAPDHINEVVTDILPVLGAGKYRAFKVVCWHDNNSTASESVIGDVAAPAEVQAVNFGSDTYPPRITWTLPTNVSDDMKVEIYRDDASAPKKTFGIHEAEYWDDLDIEENVEEHKYGVALSIGSGKDYMRSIIVWKSGVLAPQGVTRVWAEPNTSYDGAIVHWTNPTSKKTGEIIKSDGCEVAWSPYSFAWQSNKKPEQTEFDFGNMDTAYIMGLDAGKTYYFWVRRYNDSEGDKLYSPWSEIMSADTEGEGGLCTMSSIPNKPVLTLSRSWMKMSGDGIGASWNYSSDGGSDLLASKIDMLRGDDVVGSWSFGENVTDGFLGVEGLDADKMNGFEDGEYALVLYMTNSAGTTFSDTIYLTVTSVPDISMSVNVMNRGLDLEYFLVVDGFGNADATLRVLVADDFEYEAPDGWKTLHRGDVAWSYRTEGGANTAADGTAKSGEYYIDISTLIPGCKYVATAEYVNEISLESKVIEREFEYRQADGYVPDQSLAFINYDEFGAFAVLVPLLDHDEGDSPAYCDIYRLTADGAQLIFENAEWAKEYIDRYPMYNWEGAAYRFVARTDGNRTEWYDKPYSCTLNAARIDFGRGFVELSHSLESSDSRAKRREVRYHMGGSKTVYHAPSIERKQSLASTVIAVTEEETLESLMELSRYPGECYVRLPHGIGYAATVDVKIDRTSLGMPRLDVLAQVSLEIEEVSCDDLFMAEEVNEEETEE